MKTADRTRVVRQVIPPQKRHDNASYVDFMRRSIRALGRRVGEGDIDTLPHMLQLRDELDAAIEQAVIELRAEPNLYSWTQIGRVLGLTRQAVMRRWPAAHDVGRNAGGQPAPLR